MITEVKMMVDGYHKWLRDNTALRSVGDCVEITTPYMDRHNDHIQIYAVRGDGSYTLTDDGNTIADLEMCGCALDSPKRKAMLEMIVRGFGVRMSGKRIEVGASSDNFPSRKHNLIQTILAVNDMFCLSEPNVATLFQEDVASWLDSNDIRYSSKVKFAGATGFDYMFDFLIPKSRDMPERILHTVNRPDASHAKNLAFAWYDTKDSRPVDTIAFAIVNGDAKGVPNQIADALKAYGIVPIPWPSRLNFIGMLAA